MLAVLSMAVLAAVVMNSFWNQGNGSMYLGSAGVAAMPLWDCCTCDLYNKSAGGKFLQTISLCFNGCFFLRRRHLGSALRRRYGRPTEEEIVMNDFQKQIAFIMELDQIKKIGRQTYLADGSRKENDAEHSWHLALMAFVLADYAKEEIDILKTMKMVLLHDVVEIDAGDTYAYDTEGNKTKRARELKAADVFLDCFQKSRQKNTVRFGTSLRRWKRHRQNLRIRSIRFSRFCSMMHRAAGRGSSMA